MNRLETQILYGNLMSMKDVYFERVVREAFPKIEKLEPVPGMPTWTVTYADEDDNGYYYNYDKVLERSSLADKVIKKVNKKARR